MINIELTITELRVLIECLDSALEDEGADTEVINSLIRKFTLELAKKGGSL